MCLKMESNSNTVPCCLRNVWYIKPFMRKEALKMDVPNMDSLIHILMSTGYEAGEMGKHIKPKARREPMGRGKAKHSYCSHSPAKPCQGRHLFWPSSLSGSSSVPATAHC